jgi:hypothetical protein
LLFLVRPDERPGHRPEFDRLKAVVERGEIQVIVCYVMTLAQQRSVIAALVEITLISPGRGNRPSTDNVRIERKQAA